MRILNLGCGTKTSSRPEVVNIDWSMYLRLKRNPVLRRIAPLVLRGVRLQRFKALPENVMVHNLANGIPFESDSVDAVYHSHMFEHLSRDTARVFLLEVKRVLKPGGIQRIVVPDFEKASRAYLAHFAACDGNAAEAGRHDDYVAKMIEQCVRREGAGARQQPALLRFLDNLIIGDARARGEVHQWMYDRINLCALLTSAGFKEPAIQTYNSSRIPGWNEYGLDRNEQGIEYKKDSLYVEAVK